MREWQKPFHTPSYKINIKHFKIIKNCEREHKSNMLKMFLKTNDNIEKSQTNFLQTLIKIRKLYGKLSESNP